MRVAVSADSNPKLGRVMGSGRESLEWVVFVFSSEGLTLYSTGLFRIVAYVMHTWDKGKVTMDDVLIVWDYPYVFP